MKHRNYTWKIQETNNVGADNFYGHVKTFLSNRHNNLEQIQNLSGA